ncbi:phage protease [Erwinia tracheiphila]|uniref:Protease n=1 Tax=Erwinia tracheiphila TaxID=65700 RepID=A0A0M2K8K5_9GAMM|nr:phage protease [Erwinia tracheiphila]EOS94176.1 protease [Erwinia tracheiphila PSU-1]KKF35720.1 protease [Erwinia tracheiphila]UIA89111.1 phage protease [Erwinia tracheiphila]UIA89894.1 phage protease [Erwinia tracheiphila]UIA98197.1 phage protease [Erwinia tracheiphila]
MKTKKPAHPRLAILNSTLADPNDGWYQLLPAGHFSARDGRPEDVASGTWFMDADIARAFIEATAAVNQPVLFDYNHVTLKQDTDAKAAREAVAAAWLRNPRENMQWREGDGLYVRPELTPAAQAAVDAREWGYLSAVFPYDEQGHPLFLRMGALTNDPGLTGMSSLVALAAQLTDVSPQKVTVMNDYIRQLLERLGIELPENPDSLTEEDLGELWQQALSALDTLLSAADVAVDAQSAIEDATSPDDALTEVMDVVDGAAADIVEAEQILEDAALNGVDLTRFVPAKAYQLLARRAAVLSARSQGSNVESVIQNARRSGRVTAAEVPYLRALGKQHGVAELNAAIQGRKPVVALTARQTRGLNRPTRLAVLSVAEKDAARLQGLTEAEYLKRKKGAAK